MVLFGVVLVYDICPLSSSLLTEREREREREKEILDGDTGKKKERMKGSIIPMKV